MIALQPVNKATDNSTERRGSAELGAVLEPKGEPENSAQWLLRQAQEPRVMREWASALRRPVETVFEEAILRDPERMARMLAPALDHAEAQRRTANRAQATESAWRWITSLTTPRVWSWTLHALWQGEPPWRYIEERAMWYEVVEVAIFDPRNGVLLAKAETPSRARLRNAPPLESIPFLGASGKPAYQLPAELEASPSIADTSQIIVLVGDRCRIAIRVTGEPPLSLRSQLQSFCFEADSLLERSGSTHSAVRQLLEKIAQHALLSNGPKSGQRIARHSQVIFSLGLLLCTGLLTWMGVREYRWQTFLGLVRQSPGVHVLYEESAWGRTRIGGVLDSNSGNPIELAIAMGIDLQQVDISFTHPEPTAKSLAFSHPVSTHISPLASDIEEPKLTPRKEAKTESKPQVKSASAPTPPRTATALSPHSPAPAGLPEVTAPPSEEALPKGQMPTYHSVATLRALLRLPESLQLSLNGSKLSAIGALPEPDYKRLVDAPQRFAWVVEVDMTQVEDLTGDEIKGHLRAIESAQIGFKPQSEAFDEPSIGTIASLAKDIQSLAPLTALKHQTPHLAIIAVGQDADADSPMIDSRKSALQLALMRQGVRPEYFETDNANPRANTNASPSSNHSSEGLVLQVTLSPTSH